MVAMKIPSFLLVQVVLTLIGCYVGHSIIRNTPISLFLGRDSTSQLIRRAFHYEVHNVNAKFSLFELNCTDQDISPFNDYFALRPLIQSRFVFLLAGQLHEGIRDAIIGFTTSHRIPYVAVSNPTDSTHNLMRYYDQRYESLGIDDGDRYRNNKNDYNRNMKNRNNKNYGVRDNRNNNENNKNKNNKRMKRLVSLIDEYNPLYSYAYNNNNNNNNRYSMLYNDNNNNNNNNNNNYNYAYKQNPRKDKNDNNNYNKNNKNYNNHNNKNYNYNNNYNNNRRDDAYILYIKPTYEKAMVDLMMTYNWTNIYYVYDSSEGLNRLDQLYKITSLILNLSLSIEPLKLSNLHDSHMLLRQMDVHGETGEDRCIILDMTNQENLEGVLKQIQAVGMNRAGYHYLLGGMFIDEIDIDDFKHGGVNITGFQLINRSDVITTYKQRDWSKREPHLGQGNFLKLEAALAMDSVLVIADAISQSFSKQNEGFQQYFYRNEEYNQDRGIFMNNKPPSPLPLHANSIILQNLKKVHVTGMTGPISFDDEGLRKDYSLGIHELKLNKPLKQIGEWDYRDGLRMMDRQKKEDDRKVVVQNRTRVITTIISAPFLFEIVRKEDEVVTTVSPAAKLEPTGLEEYQGYCADLTVKLAEIVNFKFLVQVAPDRKYGEKTDNGTWNGMVGQLTMKKADVAIAPLTITSIRERVIDFTKPFMNLGISIMIKKPEKQKPGVFSFMDPLALNIWACIVISYLAVSFVLFLVSRFSPYEWQAEDGKDSSTGVVIESNNVHNNNDHLYLYYNNDNNNNYKATSPLREDSSPVMMSPGYTNDFTVLNSLWFSLAAFMRQGTDISPRSLSGRVVGSAWWFFTLIIISSYTANLAAFLTVERMLTPIENADDLSKQRDILYGTLLAGSSKEFFRNSKITTFVRMWDFMYANQGVFVDSTEDGVNRVRNSKGKYAHLLESTMNDYHNQKKPCNTMKVGNDLDSKGYGVATPIGSDLREPIGLAILQLLEKDYLAKLHKKWWFDKGECVSEDSKGGSSSQSALTLSNVAGIFYILIGGLGLSMVTSLLEFIYKSKREISKHKKTFAAEACKLGGGGDCENGGFNKRDPLLSPLSPHQPPAYQQLVTGHPDDTEQPPQPTSDDYVLNHRTNRSAIVLV